MPKGMYQASATDFIHAVKVSEALCHCGDYWHYFWSTLKAAGLRRGIYLQKHLFEHFLNNRTGLAQKTLIAGSADSGTLEILHGTLKNTANIYYAIDHCPAPLQLLTEYSEREKIQLSTSVADIEKLPPGPWDIILCHNTFAFIPKEKRLRVLKNMARNLTFDGVILCGMRYNKKFIPTKSYLTAEIEKMRKVAQETFQDLPEIQSILLPKIESYVTSQLESIANRVGRQEFYAEIAAAGLRITDRLPDTQVMASVTTKINDALNIEAELMVLQN